MLAARSLQRFSLLLLEESEDYVGDWAASAVWPAAVEGNWSGAPRLPGRLRLASKSLFFDPDDTRVPIVRMAFAAVQQLEPLANGVISVAAAALTKMKANCADAPYIFEKGAVTVWRFALAYAGLEEVLPAVQHHMAISRLPYVERAAALKDLAATRAEQAAFDASRLADFTERIHFNAPAFALSPLVREAGRLVITDARVYFQPAVDWRGEGTVRSHPLAHIAAVVRRRASLRPTGLELFFMEQPTGWGAPSAFFQLAAPEAREHAISKLRGHAVLGSALPGGRRAADACASILEAEGGWLRRVTAAWQAGRLPNLDYLLFLNLAAGRSFCDLAQWPVVPWVLADYTSAVLDLSDPRSFRDLSKPVGALNGGRLAALRARYADMPREEGAPPPFLYGTHYSCPGYVMFWLVRVAPGHLLRLQNGRFDTADRLFNSVAGAWDSVTSTAPDVKELIPEFFLRSPAFLTNRLQLALGTRQDGQAVDEVRLPPWAAGADDFLAKHRAALESPHVSANLHHWVDLIFGYKQRGPQAEAADNVFHHLTYEGAAGDIDALPDPQGRAALEAQVNEFGQCPAQLFTEPHPLRCASPPWAPQSLHGSTVSPTADPSADEGRALSLALMSAILAAIDDAPMGGDSASAGSPHNTAGSLVRPPELAKLDVLPQRQPPMQQQLQQQQEGQQPDYGPAATRNVSEPAAGSQARLGQHHARTGAGAMQQQAASTSRGHVPDSPASPKTPVASPQLQCAQSGSAARAAAGLASIVGSLTSPFAKAADTGAAEARGPQPVQRMPSLKSLFTRVASYGSAASPHSPAHAAQSRSGSGAQAPQQPAVQAPPQAAGTDKSAADGGSIGPWTQPDQRAPLLPKATGLHPWRLGGGRKLAQLQAPAAALARAAGGSGAVLAACQDGCLRTVPCAEGGQVAEQPLGMSALTSLAMVPTAAADADAASLAFAGSADCQVYACRGDTGVPLGTWLAHTDAVSAVEGFGGAPSAQATQLLTASWDGSIKLWQLAEGRQPWGTAAGAAGAAPALQMGGGGGGVWSAAASDSGRLVATGGDDGVVSLWDVCSGACAWQAEASRDYIAAVALLPGETAGLAAAADGRLLLLDLRAGSRALAAQVACGAPLSCLLVDGAVAVAGSMSGQMHAWHYTAAAGQDSSGGRAALSNEGSAMASLQHLPAGSLLRSAAAGESAVNALLSMPGGQQAALGTGAGSMGQLLAGAEDGNLLVMARHSWS